MSQAVKPRGKPRNRLLPTVCIDTASFINDSASGDSLARSTNRGRMLITRPPNHRRSARTDFDFAVDELAGRFLARIGILRERDCSSRSLSLSSRNDKREGDKRDGAQSRLRNSVPIASRRGHTRFARARFKCSVPRHKRGFVFVCENTAMR